MGAVEFQFLVYTRYPDGGGVPAIARNPAVGPDFAGALDSLPAVISGAASGAGSVLAAISGSLITVITTVFSLTIVTLTLVSGQYSPRLLRSFMGDRGLQVVLGVYIGTFVYSLMVLRLISTSGGEASGFNPVVSVAVAILLVLLCVALLIYFINHVAQLIQSSTIVLMAHSDTIDFVSGLNDHEESTETPRRTPSGPVCWPSLRRSCGRKTAATSRA